MVIKSGVIKPRKKSNKKITLSSFRAWLEGVEEMQKLDWCPSVEQWNLIRDKIDLIEERIEPNFPQGMTRQQTSHPLINNFQHSEFNRFESEQPESLIPNIKVSPELNQRYEQMRNNPTLGGMQMTEGKIKTPDIDTSNGNFSSSFE